MLFRHIMTLDNIKPSDFSPVALKNGLKGSRMQDPNWERVATNLIRMSLVWGNRWTEPFSFQDYKDLCEGAGDDDRLILDEMTTHELLMYDYGNYVLKDKFVKLFANFVI